MFTELSSSWAVWLLICACLCIVCICICICVWVAWKALHSEPQSSPEDPEIVPMIVEKAALGIVEEGKLLGKLDDAETMAKPQPTLLLKERFMTDPIAPKRSLGGEYGWISPFIKEVRKHLDLKPHQSPSEDPEIVSMIVEKASAGIIEEGKSLGQLGEAEEMAKRLKAKQNQGMKEIWECCAHLYTMNTFLHKTLNKIMRDIGDEEQEHIWRSKIGTLGPYCFLLWDCPFNNRLTKNIVIYRGAGLSPEQIDTYQKMCGHPHEYRSFQAFTSCSRNRSRAEPFGNVLFIMEIQHAFIVNLIPYSEYPKEEEELIFPGVCFNVQKMDFDKVKDKHLFYLKLTQRFNRKYDSFFHNRCGMIEILLKILKQVFIADLWLSYEKQHLNCNIHNSIELQLSNKSNS
jgi:hypothetical protein